MRACALEGRAQLRWTRAGDGKPEHRVQEERGGGDCSNREHDRDQDRALQHVERLAVQCVRLPVEHGQPDPNRRQDLDEREAPVRDQQLHAVEERDEPAHHECQRRKEARSLTQRQDGVGHHRLIAFSYGMRVPTESRSQRRPASTCRVLRAARQTLWLWFGAGVCHRRSTISASRSPPTSRITRRRPAGARSHGTPAGERFPRGSSGVGRARRSQRSVEARSGSGSDGGFK